MKVLELAGEPKLARFGQITVLLRGMHKVTTEWILVCLACNLRRLHVLGAGPKLAARGENPLAAPARSSFQPTR